MLVQDRIADVGVTDKCWTWRGLGRTLAESQVVVMKCGRNFVFSTIQSVQSSIGRLSPNDIVELDCHLRA